MQTGFGLSLSIGINVELEKVPCGLGDVGDGWEGGREFGGPLALDSGLSVHPALLSKSHVEELGKSSNSKSIFPEKWLNGLPADVLSDVRGLHESLLPPLPPPPPPPPPPLAPPVLKAIEFDEVATVAVIPRALIPPLT